MKLAQFISGKDNNFNLIRILAAYSVLVTHSFALATGDLYAEPLRAALGVTIGTIAVDVFFVISGFLVTASLLTRQSLIEFAISRVLRIYPALLTMMALVVFGLGLFFTSLSWSSYLEDPRTYDYLAKGATLVWGVEFVLPGVFETNPFKLSVNGSLWTLPNEVWMYLTLSGLWLAVKVAPKSRALAFKSMLLLLTVVTVALELLSLWQNSSEHQTLRFACLFFTGSTYFLLKDYISLRHDLFGAILCATLVSLIDAKVFSIVYLLAAPYLLFYLAYVPTGFIRKYNRVGDYSFGIYIYAFPVQQSIAALIPGVGVLEMLSLATVGAVTMAVLSWHLIEHPSLERKGYCVLRTRLLFESLLARVIRNKR